MSNEIKSLQSDMRRWLDAMYRHKVGSVHHTVFVEKYDNALTVIIEKMGGPELTPAYYDPDKFEVLHNVYKSDYGFRPRGKWTIASMNKWLADHLARQNLLTASGA